MMRAPRNGEGESVFTKAAVELVTLIAKRNEGNPRFGLTKLAKEIFYIDKRYYLRHGRTLSGLKFFKFERGPFTKDFYEIVEQNTGHLKILRVGQQERVMSSRNVLEGVFDQETMVIIEAVIDELRDHFADGVSSESHGIAWSLPEKDLGLIPEESYAFGEPGDMPEDVKKAAEEIIASL